MTLTAPVNEISLVDDRRSQYISVYESAAAVTGYLIIQSIGVSSVEFFSCILNLLSGYSPENDGKSKLACNPVGLLFTISEEIRLERKATFRACYSSVENLP